MLWTLGCRGQARLCNAGGTRAALPGGPPEKGSMTRIISMHPAAPGAPTDPSSCMGTAHITSTPLSGGFCCPVLSPQLPDVARLMEVAGSRAAFPCPETHP